MNRLALVALLSCSLLAVGCQNSSKSSETASTQQAAVAAAEHTDTEACQQVKAGTVTSVNKYCVVMLADPVDPTLSVDYKGQKVGFCCPGCTKKWDKMNDTQRDAALAAAVAKK